MSSESSSAMGASDLLGVHPTVQVELSGGNHHTRHFIPPEKGHQYILQMYPTSEFVKHKMETMKEPSVMLLRGCDQLSLQSDFCFEKFKTLTVLEISSFSKLTTLPDQAISGMIQLQHLNLSHLPIQQLHDNFFSNLENLRSLVLRGCSNLQSLPDLRHMETLECLDLSDLSIESVDFISGMVHLRYLILQRCTRLTTLPALKKLRELEVLDLSGCVMLGDLPEDVCDLKKMKELSLSDCTCLRELGEGLFDEMGCLEKLDLSKTQFDHLPSFSNLTNLQTLHLSHTFVEQVPDLSNVKVFFHGKDVPLPGNENGVVDLIQGRISHPNELHLVSTFFTNLPFDRFRQDFDRLVGIISNMKNDTFIPLYRTMPSMRVDLDYIFDNIARLESSRYCTRAENLLADLITAATRLSNSDLSHINLLELIRTYGKLKLLVPIGHVEDDVTVLRKTRNDTQANRLRDEIINPPEILEEDDIRRSYDSLKEIQLRNCLFYFSAFPCRDGRLIIKERVLIQLWYGEGFIDPQQEELENDGVIEEVGRNILMLLRDKGFINKQVGLDAPTTFWCMIEQVHTFVRKRAQEECFFYLDHRRKMRTRACLSRSLSRSKYNYLSSSSCTRWAKYSNGKLKKFDTMRTLLNADETVVNIRGEWFSRMRNLNVLHLGRWFYYHTESIDVMDLEFLEELKTMKQLRLLSLDGFPTYTKLPDSICKLANLKLLSLRGCGYLEELPTGIGSLKNLTHLDLTDCHSLYILPKGLRFLSKLEVLKGFVICYKIGGRQQKDACNLKDLLRLERLRMLKLCVNRDLFPDIQDLQVFKNMNNLYNLKITWKRNYSKVRGIDDVIGQKVSRQSRFQQLKCWEVTEELLINNDHLDKLKKLKLHFFPLETAPDWLVPSEMRNLEKLSIVGGELKTLAGQANENEWNVKTLCLRNMRNLEMDWQETRSIFPQMKYLLKYKCDQLSSFPCDSLGVLELESEEDELPSE